MEFVKTCKVEVEIVYDDSNCDAWIEETVFRTDKKEGRALRLTSFTPNLEEQSLLEIINEMEEMLDQTKEELQIYRDPKRLLGE